MLDLSPKQKLSLMESIIVSIKIIFRHTVVN